jgi:hypothetical protein
MSGGRCGMEMHVMVSVRHDMDGTCSITIFDRLDLDRVADVVRGSALLQLTGWL